MWIAKVWLQINSSFWFIPTFYGFVACILAFVSIQFDYVLLENSVFIAYIPEFLLVDITLAQTLLSTISSSLLTMTSITFSSIMVVLTTYLSQFSPRTLQNFMMDHHTQRVLGIFIGGFIYSILLLLLLREQDLKLVFISPSLAIVYAIMCVLFFAFFIHHVANWIQVGHLIHHITDNTIRSIHANYQDKEEVAPDSPWEDWESEEIKYIDPIRITSKVEGYLQLIELDPLIKQTKKDNVIIKIDRSLGDYVDFDRPFLLLWKLQNNVITTDYTQFFSIGSQRSTIQDIKFGITKLVEIGLRALSPGINDPNTAISCIQELGKVIAVLGSKNIHRTFYNDDNRALRLIMEQQDFKDYLYLSFFQIRQYGTKDISVLTTLISTLKIIAEQNDQQVKDIIWAFNDYILEGIKHETLLSLDKKYVNQKLEQLSIACHKHRDFIPI